MKSTDPELPPAPYVLVNVGVADYFDNHPEDVASILVAKAPDVLVLARCIGAPKTARYFEERLNCKVTERMIKTLKLKVAKDIILVTREELETAARSHPATAARMAREPSLCDPQSYRAAIKPGPEQAEVNLKIAKKAAAKRAAKNAAKVEIENKTKTTEFAKPPDAKGFTPRNPAPVAAPAKPEERTPEKEKQFAAFERLKQKTIPK
ncbi:MAG: hypothetical protein WCK77_12015 [Verrucomicrobiota bacterium]